MLVPGATCGFLQNTDWPTLHPGMAILLQWNFQGKMDGLMAIYEITYLIMHITLKNTFNFFTLWAYIFNKVKHFQCILNPNSN